MAFHPDDCQREILPLKNNNTVFIFSIPISTLKIQISTESKEIPVLNPRDTHPSNLEDAATAKEDITKATINSEEKSINSLRVLARNIPGPQQVAMIMMI